MCCVGIEERKERKERDRKEHDRRERKRKERDEKQEQQRDYERKEREEKRRRAKRERERREEKKREEEEDRRRRTNHKNKYRCPVPVAYASSFSLPPPASANKGDAVPPLAFHFVCRREQNGKRGRCYEFPGRAGFGNDDACRCVTHFEDSKK